MFDLIEKKGQVAAEIDADEPLPVFLQLLDENKEPWHGLPAVQAEFKFSDAILKEPIFFALFELKSKLSKGPSYTLVTGWKPGGRWLLTGKSLIYDASGNIAIHLRVPVRLLK